ncbi:MAG TPA: peptidoglycan-binding protein [Candidatus Tenderia electrophaga]|uniref:Peptidoglycan-binding protein n=1 Tax=Candidatus Tenderia electrophaga TaxID=1748243 RepID=A0A832J837_9GAMM|nr:peptidoglycan-binding protein [Candidatus Tenderia electrophaga]
MAISTGLKKKLKLSPCSVDDSGNVSVDDGASFEVMLNPSNYSHTYSIAYNKKEALGQLASDTKFSGIKPEKVSFDIVIDGTGVVELAGDDVKTQVKALTDIVYKYDGNNHEPNHVRVLWGSLIFFGRLESMDVEYTLFKPSGEPLRAKVKLAFAGFMSKEEEALRANRSSPDLSHRIEVKAGDTLPALCYRVYKDSSYYLEVAKANNITNFRDIAPGSTLHFPPLR